MASIGKQSLILIILRIKGVTLTLSPILKTQLCRDAPFAWLMRDKAVSSSRYTPNDIAFFDSRLDGYLDFLKTAEAGGEEILSALDSDDWGSVFVHTWHALESTSESDLRDILPLIDSEEQWREFSSALSYHSLEKFLWATSILNSLKVAEAELSVLRAINNHRIKPDKAYIEHFINSSDERVVIKFLQLVGNVKLQINQDFRIWNKHPNQRVRFYALRADILLGNTRRITELGEFIEDDNPLIIEALLLLFPLQTAENAKVVIDSINRLNISPRIKLWAMGVSGLTEYIPNIIEWSLMPEFNPVAGEAFACITGANIEEDDLSPILQTEHLEQLQSDSNDHWAQEYESDLPRPGHEELKQWWDNNKAIFTNGRYLNGKPYEHHSFLSVLQAGNQLQRRVAAVALALYHPKEMVANIKNKVQIKNNPAL